MNEKDKPQMDWQQVVLNGGPPCFFVEGPQYCGRAQRWAGHGNKAFHNYVSLDGLLTTVRKEARAKGLLEGLREADQIGFVVGAVRERIQILESEQRRAIEAAASTEGGGGGYDER